MLKNRPTIYVHAISKLPRGFNKRVRRAQINAIRRARRK